MKTLYVIRHAKSSWADPDQADMDRGLNERGKRDAPRIARRLKEKNIHPQLMLSSPAKRALNTAKRIAEVLDYPIEKVKTDRLLYHADEETILSVVQALNDKCDHVFLYGHNPGLTEFVNSLPDKEVFIDNVPTCGVAAFELPVESWKDASWRSAALLFFDYPKKEQ
jgi:phosphohistidine phosphatase